MTSIGTHILASLLIATFLTDVKYTPLCVVYGVFPDIDILFHGLHRKLLHNMFALYLSTVPTFRIGNVRDMFLIWLCYYIHLLLDAVTGGVALAYPLYEKMFTICNIWNMIWISGLLPRYVDKLTLVLAPVIATAWTIRILKQRCSSIA